MLGFTSIVEVREFDRRTQLDKSDEYARQIKSDVAAALTPYTQAA